MRKFIALVALSLSLIGCASLRQPQPRLVVTGEVISYATIYRELRPLMTEEHDPQIVLMDPVYGCISEAATRKIIAEGLANFPVRYIESARDCEDISIEATVIFRHIFRRDTGNVPLGPPFGIIGGALVADISELGFVSPGYPLYHAMCAVRCDGGKWLLIEVQSKQVVELTGMIYEGSFELFLFIL